MIQRINDEFTKFLDNINLKIELEKQIIEEQKTENIKQELDILSKIHILNKDLTFEKYKNYFDDINKENSKLGGDFNLGTTFLEGPKIEDINVFNQFLQTLDTSIVSLQTLQNSYNFKDVQDFLAKLQPILLSSDQDLSKYANFFEKTAAGKILH